MVIVARETSSEILENRPTSVRQGRGSVSVIEQPSQYNNYTAVVRVLDPQGGYGYYDFDLIWQ